MRPSKSSRIKIFVPFVFPLLLASCSTSRKAVAQGQYQDPVCGTMGKENIDHTYDGSTFYFDSEECREIFKKNPERFRDHQQKSDNKRGSPLSWMSISGIVMAIGMTGAMIFGINH